MSSGDLSGNSEKFRSLNPFLDKEGILRSHGRLALTEHVPYNTRFPIILNATSHFVKLLVNSYHRKYEHAVGIEAAKHKLRDDYFIIGVDNLLRSLRSS
jgi:hypothetical protein